MSTNGNKGGNILSDTSEKKINSFDFDKFLKDGGKIRHLINPKMFE